MEDLSVKVLGGAKTGTTTAAGADEGAADEAHERAVAITDIQIETKTLRAFNLEVQNAHTFFVGKDGVLVHNATPSNEGIGKPGVNQGTDPRKDWRPNPHGRWRNGKK